MADAGEFEKYFHQQAQLAEDLFCEGWREDAYLVACVSLDAVAATWQHDVERGAFPSAHNASRMPAALRMNRLLDTFLPGDKLACRVAVVLFAEDMQRMRPDLSRTAQSLLTRRTDRDGGSAQPEAFRAAPAIYLDCSVDELWREAPELPGGLRQVAEHYRYPAFAYRFIRSSTVHGALRGERVNRFAGVEVSHDVDYFPEWVDTDHRVRPISLGIGVGVLTHWLRTTVSEYVKRCSTPAEGFEPSREAQRRLDRLWKQRA